MLDVCILNIHNKLLKKIDKFRKRKPKCKNLLLFYLFLGPIAYLEVQVSENILAEIYNLQANCQLTKGYFTMI